MIDEYSGWPWVAHMRKSDSQSVCKQLDYWFNTFGICSVIRSDQATYYASKYFNDHFRPLGVKVEYSSARSPSSNGKSESAVFSIKRIHKKCLDTKEDFEIAINAFRNAPRADGYSPSQLMFGRRLKTRLPVLEAHLQLKLENFLEGRKKRNKAVEYSRNHSKKKDANFYPELKIGFKLLQRLHHKENKFSSMISQNL